MLTSNIFWNKTIFKRSQKAEDYINGAVQRYLQENPEDKYMKVWKDKKIKGYTYNENDDTLVSFEINDALEKLVKDFIEGWIDWRNHTKENTKNIYGEVHLCEGGYDDYYVDLTPKGLDFLRTRLSKISGISENKIIDIDYGYENSDNIENLCDFYIFTKNEIIQYWTYFPDERLFPICMLSEVKLEEYLKETEEK
ncbi:MAG: hypothetical protein J6T10_21765 [Methanobrevibacter sp.]|nr:hypothetical protein [Methanobrevibacter sp.]